MGPVRGRSFGAGSTTLLPPEPSRMSITDAEGVWSTSTGADVGAVVGAAAGAGAGAGGVAACGSKPLAALDCQSVAEA